MNFLAMIKKAIYSGLKNCPHTLFEHQRHRMFQGHFFYYIEFGSGKDVSRLKKIVKKFADVLTLEEHHKKMLAVYTERIQKQF